MSSGRKTKSQPSGDDLMAVYERKPPSELLLGERNRKKYRERKERVCEFEGCITRLRYASTYAPYCDMHGTKDRRREAKARLA